MEELARGTSGPETTVVGVPSFGRRLLWVFLAPGRLGDTFRSRPRWGDALLLGGVLIALSAALIPGDIWLEMIREQAAERGQPMPNGLAGAETIFRITSVLGGLLGWFVWAFFLAGLVTLFFAFILGDEGRYAHYLAVVSHGLLVSAVGGLLLVPLRIAERDPTLTLSVGTFALFLEEGYGLRVLKMLDLFGLWGYGVMAVMVSRLRPGKGMVLPAGFLFGLALALAFVFGLFQG